MRSLVPDVRAWLVVALSISVAACSSWESRSDAARGGTSGSGGGNAGGAGGVGTVGSGGAGGLPCIAGSACLTAGETCTDVFGSSCSCVGPEGSSYLACAPGLGLGGGGGASGGAAGLPPIDRDPTACAGAPPWTTGTPQTTLVVDAGVREKAWSRYYEKGVAADHANTVLDTAWGRNIQRALKKGRELAGFEYVRFHGILNGDIGVYQEEDGNAVYDWTRFDQVYDAVVAAGMRPVVEIGFTPPPLASDPAAALHWYNNVPANKSQPKDWNKWRAFMAAIVQHLEARYGVEEVRSSWFFEVWNEASWMYSPGEAGYIDLYYYTVTGLLAGDPEVKVGGPAASAASSLNEIPRLVRVSKNDGHELDFVSWHRYGNDGAPTNYADANGMLTYFERISQVIADSGFTGLSINDEWGPSFDAALVRDSEANASFIAKTVHLIGTSARFEPPYMFGYWTISDLYEEFWTGNDLAYREGNYGLMLKGDHRYPVSFDVEKPAFNAFRLLHMLGDVRVATSGGTIEDGVNAVATVTEDGSAVQVLVYNHVNGGAADSSASSLVTLTVDDLPFTASNVAVRHYMVDRDHSNSYRPWIAMGRPAQPTEEQWTTLSDSALLCYYEASAAPAGGTSWSVTYPQNVYGVSLFVLTPADAAVQ